MITHLTCPVEEVQHCSHLFQEPSHPVVAEVLLKEVEAEQSQVRPVEETVAAEQQLLPCTVDNTVRRLHIHHKLHRDLRQCHNTEHIERRNRLQKLGCQHQVQLGLLDS